MLQLLNSNVTRLLKKNKKLLRRDAHLQKKKPKFSVFVNFKNELMIGKLRLMLLEPNEHLNRMKEISALKSALPMKNVNIL